MVNTTRHWRTAPWGIERKVTLIMEDRGISLSFHMTEEEFNQLKKAINETELK